MASTSQLPDHLIGHHYRDAPNLTTDNNYITRGGTSGQYGGIQPFEYLKKIETTCMYENENQIEDHFRATLIDRTPEAPTLASDVTRTDRHSKEVLSIRHAGARTAEEPNHPDLNLSFTDRDPRGINVGPNMDQMAKQAGARMKFKDFKNDNTSDMQSTGGYLSEAKAIKDRRSQIGIIKKKWKIFESARDGMAVRSNMPHYDKNKRSDVGLVQFDDVHLRINESSNTNQDAVTRISNNMPIGSRLTTSHRFKTANYSQARSVGAAKVNNDFRAAIDQSEADHKTDESKEGKTRAIAFIMSTAAARESEFTAKEVDGKVSQQRWSAKVGNVREGFENTECSAVNASNMIFQHYLNRPNKATRICTDRLSTQGEVDKTAFGRLLQEMRNVKRGPYVFDTHADVDESQVRTEGYKTMNYTSAPRGSTDRPDVDETQSHTQAHNTQLRKASHNQVEAGLGHSTDMTADTTDTAFMDRKKGGLGVKSRVRYMVDDAQGANEGFGEMNRSSGSRGSTGSRSAIMGAA